MADLRNSGNTLSKNGIVFNFLTICSLFMKIQRLGCMVHKERLLPVVGWKGADYVRDLYGFVYINMTNPVIILYVFLLI